MKVSPSMLLTLLIASIVAFFVLSARDFPFTARVYPWVVGIPTFLLCILLLIRNITRSGIEQRGTGLAVEMEVDYDMPASTLRTKLIQNWLWIAGLYAGIWLIGFKVAFTIFFLTYATIQSGGRWFKAVAVTAIAVVFLVYFDLVLHAFWPEGILKQWLHWLP